ncbi:MAG: methyltransferase domain-containing protein, partial [Proteobacteria bacterium]
PPDPGAVNGTPDPGLAFGTGTHATTTWCLQALAGLDLAHRTVLDFGCGSGILAIAALRLGAARALATDVDPRALDATRRNAELNGVAERLEIADAGTMTASIADGRVRADVVIANILAEALVELADTLLQAMAPGAVLLLSGILGRQCGEVKDAYPTINFDVRARQEWRLLATR